MRIIARGKPIADEWRKQDACSECRSLVELEASDVRYHDHWHNGTSFEWTCPVCKEVQSRSGWDVPYTVLRRMRG